MSVRIRTVKRKTTTAVMLDYADLEGARHRVTVGKADSAAGLATVREEARTRAARIELELLEGRHRPKQGEESIDGMLVEFYEHLEGSTVKNATKRAYHESITKFRRFLKGTSARRLKDVTPKLIIEYVQWQNGKAADTIAGELTRLQRIFRRCVERGAIASNPLKHPDVRDVKPKCVKHERVFSREELLRFLEGVRTRNRSPQAEDYADFFLLLAETGLRLEEGLMLRWLDVSLGHEGGSFLRVQPREDWAPKTKSSIRTVPLSPLVDTMFREKLKGRNTMKPTERIFPENWTRRSVNQTFNRVLSRLGMSGRDARGQKLRVHSFRHFYATELVRSGVDPATVRDLLGHESIVVTNRYFNVPRMELFDAVQSTFSAARAKNVPDSSMLKQFPAQKQGLK